MGIHSNQNNQNHKNHDHNKHTVAINELLCMKHGGTQIAMDFS